MCIVYNRLSELRMCRLVSMVNKYINKIKIFQCFESCFLPENYISYGARE